MTGPDAPPCPRRGDLRLREDHVRRSARLRALGVPHLELDEVFWDADWTKRDPDEARALIGAFVSSSDRGWVTDGNWTAGTEGLLDDADAFVWLDYPRRTVMARVVRRTLRRGLLRTELWHGNRENLRNVLNAGPGPERGAVVVDVARPQPHPVHDARRRVPDPGRSACAARARRRRWLDRI